MANDRKEELDRLKKELLNDMEDENLLADIPISTHEYTEDVYPEYAQPVAEEISETHPESKEYTGKFMKKKTSKKHSAAQKKEDRFLTILMAIASFLCLGIIGVLIYWLEAFLQ